MNITTGTTAATSRHDELIDRLPPNFRWGVATSAYQRFGPPTPFYIAGGIVALVGVLAFRVIPPVAAQPTPAEGIAHSGASTR